MRGLNKIRRTPAETHNDLPNTFVTLKFNSGHWTGTKTYSLMEVTIMHDLVHAFKCSVKSEADPIKKKTKSIQLFIYAVLMSLWCWSGVMEAKLVKATWIIFSISECTTNPTFTVSKTTEMLKVSAVLCLVQCWSLNRLQSSPESMNSQRSE